MSLSVRVVVRVPNWLGDIVMAMPAIAAIRRHFVGGVLALAAPAPFAGFCRAIPGVDEVVALEGRGIRALARHAAALEAGRFDTAILLTNSFATALAARRAGIPERWGYRRDYRGPLLTRPVARPRRASLHDASGRHSGGDNAGVPTTHHSRYYLALVEALGMDATAVLPRVAVEAAAVERAREQLTSAGWSPGQPLVAFAPGAAYGGAKRWPADRAADALALLHAGGRRTVLVGAAADLPAARAIESALAARSSSPAVNLVGATDLVTLMGVFEWCAVAVSNDSGAMHVASAVGRPVVGIFGPTDERATAPLGRHTIVHHDVWCRPCLLRECPIDHACLEGVTGAQVAAAVEAFLQNEGGQRS